MRRAGVALAGALVLAVEVDDALVGDHRALAGEYVVGAGQRDPQQLRVLDGVPLLGLRLGVGEKCALHDVSAPPQPRARSRSVLSSLGCTTTMPWPEKAIW